MVAFQIPPLLFDPLTETLAVIFSINFPWLCCTTVLGWAMGRGPPLHLFPDYLSFLAFLICPALPCAVDPAEHTGRRVQRMYQFGQYGPAAKIAGMAAAAVAFECIPSMPSWVMGLLQSLTLYWFTSTCLELAAGLASLVSGMPVVAPFNRPYMAATLGEFWGARWNVVAGTKFRMTVYEPMCQGFFSDAQQQHGSAAALPPVRRLLAMMATFAASGAVHELAFFHLTHRLSGRWFLFFAGQGPLLWLESWLSGQCRQAGIQVPLPLRIATATATLHTLAQMLFFPDIVAAELPRRMLYQLLPGGLCGGGPPLAGAG